MSAGRKIRSKSTDWCTPKKYVDAITDFFGGEICLDPCSNEFSIVNATNEYRLPENDGLKLDWNYKTIFVNPPYGRNFENGTSIKDWLKKCCDTYQMSNDCEIVALVPVATNTSHWKNYVFGKAASICFLYDTRLKFLENGKESGKGAPMACCLIYYGKRKNAFEKHFSKYGAIVHNIIKEE